MQTLKEALVKVGLAKTGNKIMVKVKAVGSITGLKDHKIYTKGVHTLCIAKGKFLGYLSKKDLKALEITFY